MTILDLIKELELNLVTEDTEKEREFSGAIVSDLLSNVVGNAKENDLWLTVQTHTNILAVALLRDLSAIIITGGQKPDPMLIKAANERDMNILCTEEDSFTVSGKIYDLIHKN